MSAFNPVEAQQAIKVARDYLRTMGPLPTRLVKPLAVHLESAVEYIAGLEDQVKGLTEYAEDRLNQQRSVQEYAKGHKHRADNYATANAALEAEVARLNAGILEAVNLLRGSGGVMQARAFNALATLHNLSAPAPTEPEKEN